MSAYKKVDTPELGFWEKADLQIGRLSVIATTLYAAITGVFRGSTAPKKLRHHIIAAATRKSITRFSSRQQKYVISSPIEK